MRLIHVEWFENGTWQSSYHKTFENAEREVDCIATRLGPRSELRCLVLEPRIDGWDNWIAREPDRCRNMLRVIGGVGWNEYDARGLSDVREFF